MKASTVVVTDARPAAAPASPPPAAHVGVLLRDWRAARRLSQLDLALQTGISARHLSCIETGKARPSRETVMRLADTLETPLRERNALLLAAGFSPLYPEAGLDAPALDQMRKAIDLILAQQEPYPAFLINRHWDVLAANGAAGRINTLLMGGKVSRHGNMIHQTCDPDDFRQVIDNWPEVAADLLRHLHHVIAATPTDTRARRLLDEVLAYPGVPARWRLRDLETGPSPLLTTVLRYGERRLRFFSTVTTFATPRDVTLEELRIECCFPMDDETAGFCAALWDSFRASQLTDALRGGAL